MTFLRNTFNTSFPTLSKSGPGGKVTQESQAAVAHDVGDLDGVVFFDSEKGFRALDLGTPFGFGVLGLMVD